MFEVFKKIFPSRKLIGKKITVEYQDHNEIFAKFLPASGKIIAQYTISGAKNWYLVKLDNHIDYNGRENFYILIRSRWEGREILDNKPEAASVFILLIPDMKLLEGNQPLEIENFEHVAWGMIGKDLSVNNKISQELKEKVLAMPEYSQGVNKVKIRLRNGKIFRNVFIAWGDKIIKVGKSTNIPFDTTDIIEIENDL